MRLKHFDLVVVAAIVVSSPMAPGIIDGAISATTAVTRFLIALVVCAAGGEVLQRVVSGYADQARRTQILGYDGKWSLHPDQVPVLNEVFSPSAAQYARAWEVIDAYREATERGGRGAVTLGEEMIDEASARAARAVVARGERAGMRRP